MHVQLSCAPRFTTSSQAGVVIVLSTVPHRRTKRPSGEGPCPRLPRCRPHEGHNHIALYSPINATKPLCITSGEREATQNPGVDAKEGIIYFAAATPSIDRHIYSIPLPSSESGDYDETMTPITDNTSPSLY
ncbi:hypothetical protein IAT38_007210 [Cryptococcus sp. DSM 104549]